MDRVTREAEQVQGTWERLRGTPEQEVTTDRLTAYLDRLLTSATREPLAAQEQLDSWACSSAPSASSSAFRRSCNTSPPR
jgi:hypothetical protein